MTDLTLAAADTIIKAGLAHAREKNMKPLGIVVLDARGAVKTYGAEDGTSLKRYEIAYGKAHGALAFGIGSRPPGQKGGGRGRFAGGGGGAGARARRLAPRRAGRGGGGGVKPPPPPPGGGRTPAGGGAGIARGDHR